MSDSATREREPAPGGSPGAKSPDPVRRARYRPVRLIGLLLFLQAAALAGLMAFQFFRVDWQGTVAGGITVQSAEELAPALFLPTAALALLAALSLLVLSWRGWVLAALSQGLGLAACLWLTSVMEPEPFYVYPVMVYCILLVLYLNSRTVRALFQPAQAAPGKGRHP